MKLILVSCGKRKQDQPCAASEMYTGQLFRAAWHYAEGRGERMILSAKYGLLHPETIIEPYDQTIKTDNDSLRLAREAVPDILALLPTVVVFLTAERYVRHIRPALEEMGVEVQEPLRGMTQGRRLSWLLHNKGR